MKRWAAMVVLLLAALVVAVVSPPWATADHILQYGFESREPVWQRGNADAPFKETAHRLTEEKAHTGMRSELIELEAQQGTFIYYTYDLGRAPITDELGISLYIQSNRPGIQLLCRVILPKEPDPRNLDQPMSVLILADTYASEGRWQHLSLQKPVKQLRAQQQLLRAQYKRDIQTTGAYIDRLVLNVYGGPGLTQVYTDDLVAGPLDDVRPPTQTVPPAQPAATPGGGPPRAVVPHSEDRAEVRLAGNQLLVGGQKFFMRAIRHTGTPLKTLHEAGFNTIFLDESTPPGLVEDAINFGFWLAPTLRPPDERAGTAVLTSREAFNRKVAFFLNQEAVLCWDLGTNLSFDQFSLVSRTVKTYQEFDPLKRPFSANVHEGFMRYSQNVDQLMLGIHRWPLNSSLELTGYRDWLVQHRRLALPGTYCWTWIQTHQPDPFVTVAYDRSSPDAQQDLLGPLPEQIHLLAYTAIGAGFRGLGFWSDRYLAETHTGTDRLLALALLNQELQMLEPLLASAEEPFWIDTSSPNVKAAVLRCDKGMLVLPMWLGAGAQCVPGQSAHATVELTVPHVPNGCQCWEVSPGGLRSYKWQRVPGGVKVRLQEFSMTCALVFTADLGPDGLVVRFQNHHQRVGRIAAQWAYDQAQQELKKVEQIESQLTRSGHSQPDETELLQKSREYLQSADGLRRNNQWDAAYDDAQRALRPLRVLMRAQWEDAVKKLTVPVASPYALSYFTLPLHWEFWNQVENARWGNNVLPDGGFEVPPDQVQQGWLRDEPPALDEVVTIARRVAESPEEGQQCLKLQVKPKDPLQTPSTLERTYIAVHTPAIPLPPGTLVRITAHARVPGPITGSADGAMLFDSAGGEALAVRMNEPFKNPPAKPANGSAAPNGGANSPPAAGSRPGWKKFTLYRRVPATGSIHVTMALTGLGTVYFDNVRIEPLLGSDGPAKPVAAR